MEVSERLGISPRTVKAHCDVLRQKLGVRRRRQLPIAYRSLTGDDPRHRAQNPAGRGADGSASATPVGSRARLSSNARYISSGFCGIRDETMGEATATEPQARRRRFIERPRLTRLLDDAGAGSTARRPRRLRQDDADPPVARRQQAVWYTATRRRPTSPRWLRGYRKRCRVWFPELATR